MLTLACHPASPVRRAAGRGLRIPKNRPQALVRSGTWITSGCRHEPTFIVETRERHPRGKRSP
jgi:hypothetical protein